VRLISSIDFDYGTSVRVGGLKINLGVDRKNKSGFIAAASWRNLYPKLTEYCEDLTRRALEELWRDRVMHARERYIQKRLISEALADECLGLLPWDDPVVGLAFRRSLRRESDALQRYSQVLKIFSDLVVRGIEPPE